MEHRSSPPPAPAGLREACWDLPGDSSAPGEARRYVRQILAEWGVGDATALADAALMVSELVTNAVAHGEPPITFTLFAMGCLVRGEVTDGGPTGDLPWTRPGEPGDLDAEHGRGLALVAAYASRWGVDPVREGKTVWFVLGGGGLPRAAEQAALLLQAASA